MDTLSGVVAPEGAISKERGEESDCFLQVPVVTIPLPGRSHRQRPVAHGVPQEKTAVPSREEDEDLTAQCKLHTEPGASVWGD